MQGIDTHTIACGKRYNLMSPICQRYPCPGVYLYREYNALRKLVYSLCRRIKLGVFSLGACFVGLRGKRTMQADPAGSGAHAHVYKYYLL